MGQAKHRGTYEERVAQSQLAQQVIDAAFPVEKGLRDKFNRNVRAFAAEIVKRQTQPKS